MLEKEAIWIDDKDQFDIRSDLLCWKMLSAAKGEFWYCWVWISTLLLRSAFFCTNEDLLGSMELTKWVALAHPTWTTLFHHLMVPDLDNAGMDVICQRQQDMPPVTSDFQFCHNDPAWFPQSYHSCVANVWSLICCFWNVPTTEHRISLLLCRKHLQQQAFGGQIYDVDFGY